MKVKLITMLFAGLMLATTAWAQNIQKAELQWTWAAPTTNTDGTPLTDLAGYHLCISVDTPIPADLTFETMATHCLHSVVIPADVEEFDAPADVTVPAIGTIYGRMAAYDESGNVSVFSNEASVAYDYLPADSVNMNLRIKLKKGKK